MPTKSNALISPFKLQYAVNCIGATNIPGTFQTTAAFVGGSYQTGVTTDNPQNTKIKTRIKIASPIGTSKFIEPIIAPDRVEQITRAQIHHFGLYVIHGIEGFPVIEREPV